MPIYHSTLQHGAAGVPKTAQKLWLLLLMSAPPLTLNAVPQQKVVICYLFARPCSNSQLHADPVTADSMSLQSNKTLAGEREVTPRQNSTVCCRGGAKAGGNASVRSVRRGLAQAVEGLQRLQT